MKYFLSFPSRLRIAAALCLAAFLIAVLSFTVGAHPLGNFTVNHYARIEVGAERVHVRYVIDMAEIPAFQELRAADADGDGATSSAELNAYAERVAPLYADGLLLTVDGARVPLSVKAKTIGTPTGVSGLQTLRVECDVEGIIPAGASGAARRLRFEDQNHLDRIGWREIVVAPVAGIAVFNSNAFGNGVTDEIKAYPQDMLAAPLDERVAELSFKRGAAPSGSTALLMRDGRAMVQSRDRLAELINVPEVTPLVALLGLLIAAALGALHALSPGHGKTIVGAYLIGSRGTARHAAFLGLTVTVTHTIGVFALGIITLFASQYILPERLFPALGFISGAIVLGIGLSLFARRLRAALGDATHEHRHPSPHADDEEHHHAHEHEPDEHKHHHADEQEDAQHGHALDLAHSHLHGGRAHSHLPPGADGGRVTWRSLLGLGISGGLLPCPSALVVMLSAISLHRVGYGLLLVVAFSLGLACTLTGIGLAFVFASRLMKRRTSASVSRLARVLPIMSAFVIACVGALICYQALGQADFQLVNFHLTNHSGDLSFASQSALAVLGLGLVFGLKHATEVDHVVAVSTIVSEHRKLTRAALVGALWGAGHTASLLVVGAVVLAIRVAIPERVSNWLEFCVALMIIVLGANALARALRKRADVHAHKHKHDGAAHIHIHFHEQGTEHVEPISSHSHAVARIGIKPLVVGAVHGLAGSATLTLLVLTQIESALLGLLYLLVFGLGSIIGMLLMSGLVGLPFALSSRNLTGIHYGLQLIAGIFSVAFGFWYAYETGIASGLLRTIL